MSMEQELMEKKKVFQVSTDLVLKNLQKRIDELGAKIHFFNLVSPSSMLKKVTSYIPPNDVYLMKRHKKNVNIYMR